jgi:hypothetical protein
VRANVGERYTQGQGRSRKKYWIDTSHPELYLEQNSEVKKSHERIHPFCNQDDENEAQ